MNLSVFDTIQQRIYELAVYKWEKDAAAAKKRWEGYWQTWLSPVVRHLRHLGLPPGTYAIEDNTSDYGGVEGVGVAWRGFVADVPFLPDGSAVVPLVITHTRLARDPVDVNDQYGGDIRTPQDVAVLLACEQASWLEAKRPRWWPVEHHLRDVHGIDPDDVEFDAWDTHERAHDQARESSPFHDHFPDFRLVNGSNPVAAARLDAHHDDAPDGEDVLHCFVCGFPRGYKEGDWGHWTAAASTADVFRWLLDHPMNES